MTYLHQSAVKSHGRLTPNNCFIDSRFMLKVTDYELPSLVSPCFFDPPYEETPRSEWEKYLWRAPEFLREVMSRQGSQKGQLLKWIRFNHIVMKRLIITMSRCLLFEH